MTPRLIIAILAFLVPVHVVLRVKLDGDGLGLTPVSYDWFSIS